MKTTGILFGTAIAMLVFAPMANAVTLGDPDVVINGSLNVDNATLFVDDTNNRVGLGMTNPVRDFHLRKFLPSGIGPDFLL